jgi:hypothetical protein
MPPKRDNVLDGMARELHDQLVARGLDPKNPPGAASEAPNEAAFAEYKKRGGSNYGNAGAFMEGLLAAVSMVD